MPNSVKSMVNKSIPTIIGMDTRLLEITLAGFFITKGFRFFMGYPGQGALEQHGNASGAVAVALGAILLFCSIKGIVSNNCYKTRASWMFVVTALLTANIMSRFHGGIGWAINLPMLWTIALTAFSTLLLLIKGEAVRYGCPSVRGSLTVSPRIHNKIVSPVAEKQQ